MLVQNKPLKWWLNDCEYGAGLSTRKWFTQLIALSTLWTTRASITKPSWATRIMWVVPCWETIGYHADQPLTANKYVIFKFVITTTDNSHFWLHVKSNSELLWFCYTLLSDWCSKALPHIQLISFKIKTKSKNRDEIQQSIITQEGLLIWGNIDSKSKTFLWVMVEQKCDARQVWQISSHVCLLTTEEKRGFMGGGSNYLVHKTIKTHPYSWGRILWNK